MCCSCIVQLFGCFQPVRADTVPWHVMSCKPTFCAYTFPLPTRTFVRTPTIPPLVSLADLYCTHTPSHLSLSPPECLQPFDRSGQLQPKIGDWGSARALALYTGVRSMTHGVGTTCWLAPEVRGE